MIDKKRKGCISARTESLYYLKGGKRERKKKKIGQCCPASRGSQRNIIKEKKGRTRPAPCSLPRARCSPEKKKKKKKRPKFLLVQLKQGNAEKEKKEKRETVIRRDPLIGQPVLTERKKEEKKRRKFGKCESTNAL